MRAASLSEYVPRAIRHVVYTFIVWSVLLILWFWLGDLIQAILLTFACLGWCAFHPSPAAPNDIHRFDTIAVYGALIIDTALLFVVRPWLY